MADRVGQQFGTYHLVRFLGQNSFAEVYLGKDRYIDKQVCIKILALRLAPPELQAFLTEARTIADLAHPNIVRLLHVGVEGSENVPFLVMDYALQGSLRQRYPQGVSLPLNEVVSYVKQSAAALQYAHSKGVLHRDIKPENMLVGPKGEIQLSDFSIPVVEYVLRANGRNAGENSAYTAPEQLQGRPQPASDQYALGAVVYELLSGSSPVSLGGTGGFAHARPPLREKLPHLPEAVDMVVNTALAKDPQQRFGSIQAFSHALEQAALSADGPTQAGQSLLSDPYKSLMPPPPPSSMFNPNFAQAVEGHQTPLPPADQGNPQRYGFNAALPPAEGQPTPSSGIQPPLGQPAAPGWAPQPWQGSQQPSGIQPPLRQSGQTPVGLPAVPFEDETAIMQPSVQKVEQSSREPVPRMPSPVQLQAKRQRGNFGYIAIIVLLLLLLVGGGSVWAYTRFFLPPSSPSLSPTSQANGTSYGPNVNATATAAALVAASNATPTIVGTATPANTNTPSSPVTPTASSGTQLYDKTVHNLTIPCISNCQKDNLVIVVVSVDENKTTLTWHMTVTNNGSAVCNLNTSLQLENVNTGAGFTPDSGSFVTNNTSLDVGQVLTSTAVFDNMTLNGSTLYNLKVVAGCEYNSGQGRIEQFNL